MMERKLEGKVALVTGAGRGLGRAYALRLARLGADVAINDVNLHSAKEVDEELTADTVVDEIRDLGQKAIGIECDVANREAVDDMFGAVLREFGRIDILVNNAGGLQVNPETSYASTVPEDDLRREVDRNLMSCIFCSQAASIPMKKQKSGSSYGVAKAGVIAYTRYLAGELAPHGINVNCIAPAMIASRRPMVRIFDREPGRLEAVEKGIPMGRLGTPEEAAKVVEFLVTDLSDYVVGQCISICGGAALF
jgi:NAD(P)-dependent dehydrogenase (short-subunit alcohol dehydrogenase family)